MKKMFVAIVWGMILLVGSYNTTEAAELENGYETIIAEDGCVIYTPESYARYANDHIGMIVKDKIFIQTKQHIIHSAIRG